MLYGVDNFNKSLTHDIFGRLSNTRITNASRKPRKVITTVIKLLIELLYENDFPYFLFSAHDKSRRKLYDRLVEGRCSKIANYTFTESYILSDSKHYLFNRANSA